MAEFSVDGAPAAIQAALLSLPGDADRTGADSIAAGQRTLISLDIRDQST